MAKEKKFVESITDMEVDFPQWYTDVVKKSGLNRIFQPEGLHDYPPLWLRYLGAATKTAR